MSFKVRLGNEIERLLGSRSQHWLAEAIGMRQASVSRIVAGKQRPSEKTIEKIATALQVDVWHLKALAGYKVPPRDYSPEVEAAAQRLEELPLEVRRQILSTVNTQLDMAEQLIEQIRVYEDMRRLVPDRLKRLEDAAQGNSETNNHEGE